jgi:hypothetical protein
VVSATILDLDGEFLVGRWWGTASHLQYSRSSAGGACVCDGFTGEIVRDGRRRSACAIKISSEDGGAELAESLSARMGDLLLTDKEATGLVIKDAGAARINPRWAAVGKVCSPRKLVIGALERALHRAWGLHHPAAFREIGDNRFVVKFSSEGDYRHVMKGGPCSLISMWCC